MTNENDTRDVIIKEIPCYHGSQSHIQQKTRARVALTHDDIHRGILTTPKSHFNPPLLLHLKCEVT